jgi:glycosyltransferase involved in cell wall biosynthesis
MHPGGVEMRLLEVMRYLCPHEFQADVCALSGLTGSLDDAVRAYGGDVIPLRVNRSFPRSFVRLLRHGGYDVVHSHVLYATGAILALAAHAGVSIRIAHIRHMHDGHRSTVPRRVQRRVMLGLIDRYATDIVGCSEGAMDAIMGPRWRSNPRARVIYDAVDLARFGDAADSSQIRAELGIPTDAQLFVHVGNALPVKNHARLIDIFAELGKSTPSCWLLLVGARTDEADGPIARRIHERGIGDRVVALGVRDDIPRVLNAADAVLMPSLNEGLPGVVLEACAAGVPVLATDLPGVREIASRVPLVEYLPLSASDSEWAAAARQLPQAALRHRLRETAANAFRASVFHVDRAVEAHRVLWGSCANTAAR